MMSDTRIEVTFVEGVELVMGESHEGGVEVPVVFCFSFGC